MAINEIPTGILPEEIVVALPEVGEENKVYRRLIDPNDELQMTDDFIWYDGEWHSFSFDAKIFGAYFARYQQSVSNIIANHESRIEALEGGTQYVVVVDAINYTAPNNTPVPTESPFVWDGVGYICDAEGLLADGVPTTVKNVSTLNDTDIVLTMENNIAVHIRESGVKQDHYTSIVYGAQEVTFERLIIKYELYE